MDIRILPGTPALALAWIVLSGPIHDASARQFAGRYVAADEAVDMALVLTDDGRGTVRGTLWNGDGAFPIEATVQGGRLAGTVRVGRMSLMLEATTEDADLMVALIDLDLQGRPRPGTRQEIRFVAENVDPELPDDAPRPRERRDGPPRPLGPGGYGESGPLGPNPVAPYAYPLDPFTGRFTDGRMTLDLVGSNGRYRGDLYQDGTTYAVELGATRGSGAALQGGFWSGDVEYDLYVQLTADGLLVSTGGRTSVLQRVGWTGSSYRGGVGPGGLGPYQPVLPPPGGYVARESDWLLWLEDKVLIYPDDRLSGRAYGTFSRREYHLCRDGALIVRDYDRTAAGAGPLDRTHRAYATWNGTWEFIWDDQLPELEVAYGPDRRVERVELVFRDGAVYADGEPILVAYSDRCER